MANISALDDSRRNGSPVKGGPVVKNIHTNNLVTELEVRKYDPDHIIAGGISAGSCPDCGAKVWHYDLDTVVCFSCDKVVSEDTYEGHPIPRKVNSEHYTFKSWTDSHIEYHMERNEYGVWLCGCPGFTRHYKCKHAPWFAKVLRHMAEPSFVVVKRTPAKKLELEDLFSDVA